MYFYTDWIVDREEVGRFFDVCDIADQLGCPLWYTPPYGSDGHYVRVRFVISTLSLDELQLFNEIGGSLIGLTFWWEINANEIDRWCPPTNPNTKQLMEVVHPKKLSGGLQFNTIKILHRAFEENKKLSALRAIVYLQCDWVIPESLPDDWLDLLLELVWETNIEIRYKLSVSDNLSIKISLQTSSIQHFNSFSEILKSKMGMLKWEEWDSYTHQSFTPLLGHLEEFAQVVNTKLA